MKVFSSLCILVVGWIMVVLPTKVLAQGYTGNEFYSFNLYLKLEDRDVIMSQHWYRRYHKGFFLEGALDNMGNGAHGAIGYQLQDKSTVIDVKATNKSYGTFSILKRF